MSLDGALQVSVIFENVFLKEQCWLNPWSVVDSSMVKISYDLNSCFKKINFSKEYRHSK